MKPRRGLAQARKGAASTESSFLFNFDDDAQSVEEIVSNAINPIGPFTVSTRLRSAEPKDRVSTEVMPVAAPVPTKTIDDIITTTSELSIFPVGSVCLPISPSLSHITPHTTPGTHIIYLPKYPVKSSTSSKKARPAARRGGRVPKVLPKKLPAIKPNAPIAPSQLTKLTTLLQTPAAAHIPSWVLGVTKLDLEDFECPLDAIPDLMVDPETYMFSLPNPTNTYRNIFVSITAPLRCIGGDGSVLESTFSYKRYNFHSDKHIKKDYVVQLYDATPTPFHVIHPKNQQQTGSIHAQPTYLGQSTLIETTSFAVLLPPMTIVDVCYLVHAPKHKHNFTNIADCITVRHTAAPGGDRQSTSSSLSSMLRNLISIPLACPSVIHQVSEDHLPLDQAQKHITSHIALSEHTKTSMGYLAQGKLEMNQTLLPVIPLPLPMGVYPIIQSFFGILTHFSEQTCYAVDIACPYGTPVYSPLDGIVDSIEHKSCSSGNYVLNLFDWNSVTIASLPTRFVDVDKTSSTASPAACFRQSQQDDSHTSALTTFATADNSTTLDVHPTSPQQASNEGLTTGTISPVYIDLVHLSNIFVRRGQFVKRGQLIGYTGNFGFCPHPHLHIQVALSSNNNAKTVPFVFDSKSAVYTTCTSDDLVVSSSPSETPAESSSSSHANQPSFILPEAGNSLSISHHHSSFVASDAQKSHQLLSLEIYHALNATGKEEEPAHPAAAPQGNSQGLPNTSSKSTCHCVETSELVNPVSIPRTNLRHDNSQLDRTVPYWMAMMIASYAQE